MTGRVAVRVFFLSLLRNCCCCTVQSQKSRRRSLGNRLQRRAESWSFESEGKCLKFACVIFLAALLRVTLCVIVAGSLAVVGRCPRDLFLRWSSFNLLVRSFGFVFMCGRRSSIAIDNQYRSTRVKTT